MPENKPKIKLSELTDIYDIEGLDGKEIETPPVIGDKTVLRKDNWIVNEDVDEAEDKMIEEEAAEWS